MRIAFWWKLNWSWFCLIQTSYDAATRPIPPEEIRPFPSIEQLQTDYSQSNPSPDTAADPAVKKENTPSRSNSPTPKSSDQDTISEPMEDIITSETNIPPRLQPLWNLGKELNRKPRWPREMGSEEWIEVGDFLVELGHELARFGLLDLELGFWENEIMHSTFRTPNTLYLSGFLLASVLWGRGNGRDRRGFGCMEETRDGNFTTFK